MAKREGFEPPEPSSSLAFGASTISQTRTPLRMAAAGGVEPPSLVSETSALTDMRSGYIELYSPRAFPMPARERPGGGRSSLVPLVGFEPTTFSVWGSCSAN